MRKVSMSGKLGPAFAPLVEDVAEARRLLRKLDPRYLLLAREGLAQFRTLSGARLALDVLDACAGDVGKAIEKLEVCP